MHCSIFKLGSQSQNQQHDKDNSQDSECCWHIQWNEALRASLKWQMQLQLGLIYVYPKYPSTCSAKCPDWNNMYKCFTSKRSGELLFLGLKCQLAPTAGLANACHIFVINTTAFRWTDAYANVLICIAAYVNITIHKTSPI